MHAELEAGARGAAGVEQHVRELKYEDVFMMSPSRKQCPYQEKHPLLISFPGKLLEAALSDKLSAGGDKVIIAHQVTLELHQLHQVLRFLQLGRELLDDIPDLAERHVGVRVVVVTSAIVIE